MNKDIIDEDIKKISGYLGARCKQFAGKTVLITGGSGFIGRYLVGTLHYLNEFVLKKPVKIIVIDNYITSTKKRNLINQKNIKYIEHDVTKPINISSSVDYIIHAAGIASPIHYQKYPLETIDVAINGTRNMLELARKKRVKSFLFFSSSEIYGDPQPSFLPTKETYFGNVSSVGQRACYDESKRLGEALCMVYYNYFSVPVKIVRPFNVFGPGMLPKDYRVIPRFIYSLLNNEPIPVHGDGKQTRTFCYISDAVTGFFLVLLSEKGGEIFNVGSNQKEISMNKLARVFNRAFESKVDIKNIPYPKDYPQGEPQRRCPNVAKIKKELKYRPSVSLESGLKRTVEWCKENWREL
ncbi:NAD-dependent epimerase/dehydratase family protein [Candidatus Microgenomates bacterium]|nr:MAG: NAD-dependent epimerase/dehydratase family protein [Candidatus Microgenomates bacterium]